MANSEPALRKRQQIANANRMMFLWIAAVSVVVGFSLVGAYFLWEKSQFNEKVLAVKSSTAKTLIANNAAVNELKDQVRVLNTNQSLRDSMAPGEDQPIRVILDALPSDANSSALGASLQEKFLNADGLKIESLNVDPVMGVESLAIDGMQDASVSDEGSENQIHFTFSVSTELNNASALKQLLQRLERSIRAVNISTLSIETQGNRLVLNVDGRAFYEPAKTAELKDKTVKP